MTMSYRPPQFEPNYSDWYIFKDGRGNLNPPAMILGLILFYFMFLWIFYIGAVAMGAPKDTGTWIARGLAGFLTIWAAIGNLQGRSIIVAILVFPITAYGIYYLTTAFVR